MINIDYQKYLITGTEIHNPQKATIMGLKGLTNEVEGQTL